jgi:hypothetical protein
MVDLRVCAHLQMYWSKLFKIKRLGAPKVGSGGVGKSVRMVALDVSAYVCVAIVVGSFANSVCEGDDVSLRTFVDNS